MKFLEWLKNKDELLYKELFLGGGHHQDWSDRDKAYSNINDEKYAARGIRSKYVAQMSAEKKRKSRRKRK